jgi:hypothetical protein
MSSFLILKIDRYGGVGESVFYRILQVLNHRIQRGTTYGRPTNDRITLQQKS